MWHQRAQSALELRVLLSLESGVRRRIKDMSDHPADKVRDLGLPRKLSKSYVLSCGDRRVDRHRWQHVLRISLVGKLRACNYADSHLPARSDHLLEGYHSLLHLEYIERDLCGTCP
jgi:hypothetical protein